MKTYNVLISVIIPVYKVEDYLYQCVDSVLNQSFTDVEVILVNDGSPDGCPVICDKYALNDTRVRVIHKENGGLSDARNVGLKNAKGKYVVFLDSDDYWYDDDFLYRIFEKTKSNVDIIFFKRSYLIDGKVSLSKVVDIQFENLQRDELVNYLFNSNYFECNASLKVIKKEVLIRNDLFFKKGILSEDVEWFLRVILYIDSAANVKYPHYIYRYNRPGSITNTVGVKNVVNLLDTIGERKKGIDNEEYKQIAQTYKSYLGFQLSIVIAHYFSLSVEDKKSVKSRIIEFLPLLKNRGYRNNGIIDLLVTILGLNMTSRLLNLYLTQRKAFL